MKPLLGIARCCCAAPGCELCIDGFNRSDSSDITTGSNCGWTEQTGNQEIKDNQLRFPDAGGGIATSTTTQSGTVGFRISVRFKTSSTSADPWIVFNFVDTSNYTRVEIDVSADVMRLINVSGTPTTIATANLSTSISTGVSYIIQVCVHASNQVEANLLGADPLVNAPLSGTLSIVNGTVGLGASGATIDFDEFNFLVHQDVDSNCDACTEPCPTCQLGTALDNCEVDLSGVITWPPFADFQFGGPYKRCPSCDPLNDETFNLTRISSYSELGEVIRNYIATARQHVSCIWDLQPGGECGIVEMTVRLIQIGTADLGQASQFELIIDCGVGENTRLQTPLVILSSASLSETIDCGTSRTVSAALVQPTRLSCCLFSRASATLTFS